MIGSADLVRRDHRDTPHQAIAWSVAAAVGALGFWGTGIGWPGLWWGVGGLSIVALWVFCEQLPIERASLGALAGLAGAVLAILAFGHLVAVSGGWWQRWYASLEIASLQGVTFDRFALGIGCLLFLQSTSNVIVRLVLQSAGPNVIESAKNLKGGRILGPLERSFIFAMALAGQFTAIGAVVAAKGILRFPEISRADDDGDIAEYVLVGSFASWVLALIFVPLF